VNYRYRSTSLKIIIVLLLSLISAGFLASRFLNKGWANITGIHSAKDTNVVWPADGQAAIGTVKKGWIAGSAGKEKPRPMASIAKVITALAIMEKKPFQPQQQGETYIITRDDIAGLNAYISEGGSVLPILVGMKLTQYEAMQRMLIASDNNNADVLVERIFGSKQAYLAYAQKMLNRMGLTKTVIADASGFSPHTVSTPSELITIGIAALKNPVIAKIVSQEQVRLPVAGTIKNTNQLLGIGGTIGIKTGTTSEAGSCLLFAAHGTGNDGHMDTIVGVITGSINHQSLYRDCKNLLHSARELLGMHDQKTEDQGDTTSLRNKTHIPKKLRRK
jgi:D-alanyl-D-alanine carboxypeptidase (penicillin-binding protein 5/6)